jgi:hypothetical protein
LLADDGGETAGQIQREVPVPENGIRLVVAGFHRRRRIFWQLSFVHGRNAEKLTENWRGSSFRAIEFLHNLDPALNRNRH